jgi:hypothetical protein
MPALAGPALVAAALLALAGAQKLVDPAMTVGALQALRLPSSSALVRVGSAAELALGVAAVVIGGPVLWSLVALSYLAFGAFVVTALRHGTMLGSCGCFGREDTPPHAMHVVLNLLLAGIAAGAAASLDTPVVDELVDHPGAAVAVLAIAAVALYLLRAAYVELPRAMAAGRALRSGAAD